MDMFVFPYVNVLPFNLTTRLSAFLWILWLALGGNSAGMLWLGDCGFLSECPIRA